MSRTSLRAGLQGLYVYRGLLQSLIRRDIETRYRGTALGFLWAVIYPLLMLAVYAFVFGGIFHSRWGNQGGIADFVLMLYCGLIVHGVFSDTLTRSPSAVLNNPSYVKKVVFPLELLPICQLGSAVFNALVSLGLLCVWIAVQHRGLPVTALLAPLVLAPLLLLTAGLAWFLAGLGVFFRDVGQIVNVAMSVLMFLSPVFYAASSTPPLAQRLIYLNPLTYPMETLRAVLVAGTVPNLLLWLAYSALALLVAIAGLWFFQRLRPAFADVI